MFTGRYMLLLMGFFAVYCGFIYNECFCLALNLFGSKFHMNTTMDTYYTSGKKQNFWTEDGVEGYGQQVYAFGVDPQWHMAKNEVYLTLSLYAYLVVHFIVLKRVSSV